MVSWTYAHQDLGEPPFADGSALRRPVVPLLFDAGSPSVLGVIDSGSPMSVANSTLFSRLGIDVDHELPLYEVPLSMGGRFATTPVFEVELSLHAPEPGGQPIRWRLPLGASRSWRYPFTVLLGQRGWFDRFPTRIDGVGSTVEV